MALACGLVFRVALILGTGVLRLRISAVGVRTMVAHRHSSACEWSKASAGGPRSLSGPERPTAQIRGWLDPLAIQPHHPGPGKPAESLSFLAIDAKPNVTARND